MGSAEGRRVNVLELKSLRSVVAVTWMDRVRNEEVGKRAAVERELEGRVNTIVLKWFSTHTTRYENRWVPYGMKGADDRSKWNGVWGRSRIGWMDTGNFVFDSREMTVGDIARRMEMSGEQWCICVYVG